MADRKHLPGKFVWFELVSSDAKKAQAFYGEVLGWKTRSFPMGNFSYDMILTGESLDTMIGGYAEPRHGQAAHFISYVSVEDVDRAAKLVTENGGKVIDPPMDIPTVGRFARVADPQGAEFCLFKGSNGDPPDAEAPQGAFFWDELHTTDPEKAVQFYEKVVGYTHRTMDAGGGPYHVLSKGEADRGGVTHHLQPGAPPHWLPYVAVDDVDATVARAKKLGATIPMSPEDIPGIGRFGVIIDPVGAVLAIMKPLPRMNTK